MMRHTRDVPSTGCMEMERRQRRYCRRWTVTNCCITLYVGTLRIEEQEKINEFINIKVKSTNQVVRCTFWASPSCSKLNVLFSHTSYVVPSLAPSSLLSLSFLLSLASRYVDLIDAFTYQTMLCQRRRKHFWKNEIFHRTNTPASHWVRVRNEKFFVSANSWKFHERLRPTSRLKLLFNDTLTKTENSIHIQTSMRRGEKRKRTGSIVSWVEVTLQLLRTVPRVVVILWYFVMRGRESHSASFLDEIAFYIRFVYHILLKSVWLAIYCGGVLARLFLFLV